MVSGLQPTYPAKWIQVKDEPEDEVVGLDEIFKPPPVSSK
jgi:hypothetical protein